MGKIWPRYPQDICTGDSVSRSGVALRLVSMLYCIVKVKVKDSQNVKQHNMTQLKQDVQILTIQCISQTSLTWCSSHKKSPCHTQFTSFIFILFTKFHWGQSVSNSPDILVVINKIEIDKIHVLFKLQKSSFLSVDIVGNTDFRSYGLWISRKIYDSKNQLWVADWLYRRILLLCGPQSSSVAPKNITWNENSLKENTHKKCFTKPQLLVLFLLWYWSCRKRNYCLSLR